MIWVEKKIVPTHKQPLIKKTKLYSTTRSIDQHHEEAMRRGISFQATERNPT